VSSIKWYTVRGAQRLATQPAKKVPNAVGQFGDVADRSPTAAGRWYAGLEKSIA
jgi:hypothetical protein